MLEMKLERMHQLVALASVAARALTPPEIAAAVIAPAVKAAGANGGVLGLLRSDPPDFDITCAVASPPHWIKEQRISLDGHFPLSTIIRDPEPTLLHVAGEWDGHYSFLSVIPAENQSIIVLPLIAQQKPVGVMVFGYEQPPEFGEEERQFLLMMGENCAGAIERALRHEGLLREKQEKSGEQKFLQETEKRLRSELTAQQWVALDFLRKKQQYRTLVEVVPQIAWITEADGDLLYINPQWTEFSGCTQEETKEAGWNSFLHPEDVPRAILAGKEAIQTGEMYSVEYRIRAKDGQYRWFLSRGIPTQNERGLLDKWYGTCTDIDDRKRSEQAQHFLSELTARMRSLVAPEEVLQTTVDALVEKYQVTYCAFVQVSMPQNRLSVHTLRSDNPNILLQNYPLDTYSSALRSHLEQGLTAAVSDTRTHPLTASDYEAVYGPADIQAFIAAPLVKNGEWVAVLTMGMSGTLREWTVSEANLLEKVLEQTWLTLENSRLYRAAQEELAERRRVETALRESEERLRLSVAAAHLGLWDWDLQSGRLQWDENFARLIGVPGDRLETDMQEALLDIHPEDQEMVRTTLMDALMNRTDYNCTFRVPVDTGDLRWVTAQGRGAYDETDRPIRMRGVLYDVTPQRQAEEERERYLREIEALNERLRRSVQETHHRVKNNLQVISAMANVQTLKGTDNVPAEEFARLIQHVRSLAIVHDILTHESRFGGDHPSVSAQETLESLLPLLQTMTGGRRLRFDIDEVPLSLKQTGSVAMLVNELVSNAVKHGEGDISIHLRAEGERVRLSVCDSGSGFPADFDSRRVGNTGLELIDSITRWDLNGSVEYGSDSNRAEVVIWFPRVAD